MRNLSTGNRQQMVNVDNEKREGQVCGREGRAWEGWIGSAVPGQEGLAGAVPRDEDLVGGRLRRRPGVVRTHLVALHEVMVIGTGRGKEGEKIRERVRFRVRVRVYDRVR